MRSVHCILVFLLLAVLAFLSGGMTFPNPGDEANRLTEPQVEAGWKLLFDGKSVDCWRGYHSKTFPERGWVVEDGTLHIQAGAGVGDIMTKEQFENFDLRLDWKVSSRANSGIMYLVSEHENQPWKTGPEYQILDDLGHNLDPTNSHSAGALYDLYDAPAHKPVKPAGEWNQARIIKRGPRIEHWLNGVQVVEYDLTSDDWKARRDKSKFSSYPRFGRNEKGHIDLQDHGHDVWFRNIRIRDLAFPKVRNIKLLFNGKDMTGWGHYLKEEGRMEDTWRVEDRVLICKGSPAGYIFTEKEYENFVLYLQWRFNPKTKKAGNSGVLLRQRGPHQVWPKSVEAQLQSGSAGDFWCIGEFPMKTDPDRTRGRNTKKTHFNENPVGEWNEYEIIVNRGEVTLIVNGEVLNKAWDVEQVPGRICLQSEGAEIHFRRIGLMPIED